MPAGAEVTAEFHHTIHGKNPGDLSDPIDPTHKGPLLAYLYVLARGSPEYSSLSNSAKVPSALQTDVTGLDWFKIYEDGYGPGTQWAVDRLIANEGLVTFTIPECIPAGEYLLRVELIGMFIPRLLLKARTGSLTHLLLALHSAFSYPGHYILFTHILDADDLLISRRSILRKFEPHM